MVLMKTATSGATSPPMNSPVLMVALVAIGMSLSFWAADPASPTSRSLALTLGLFGLGLVVNVVGYAGVVDLSPASQSRIHSILACGAVIAAVERVRLIALCVATPLLASGLFVPLSVEPFTTVAGELIFLGGAVRYHVLQGQRGQFLARFLSPQVARLVRSRGLNTTMQQ